MPDARRSARWTLLVAATAALTALGAGAPVATKPRAVLVVPFDASALAAEDQWVGEGVAQVVSLGLAQHPAFVQVDRARQRAGRPEAWGEAVVIQTARNLHVDAAMFGRVVRNAGDWIVQPRLLELKGGGGEPMSLDPITAAESELLPKLATLPVIYARTLKVTPTDAEAQKMEKAAQPTRSAKAFELFSRAAMATGQRPGQEGNEQAVDLLARAIEADPNFVVAQYTLGVVHQDLGNRWKAAAQFRASTQLDPKYPEPYKALGDLFLAAPRRLFEQAVEAYSKAIELRPFYGEAYVGLGDAKAAKGDVDGAIAAYTKALGYNPINPKVHMSLGKIYYAEKGLYYESVNAYKKAIELDPSAVEARMGLGEVYEDKGLYKEALEEYKRVIEQDPKHSNALYNLANVYEKVDPREAITQWERYIALASQLPSEKDWVDVARQHLRKLKNQIKD
ncbi:MAG TPA: tetratricopeptide repeat protein [Methylomirabilota bacterium]|nr:tetratricopeptide repeat protein [Methylomirabilota bacterium]